MKNIKPVSFTFQESHNVRIEIINDDPWFCLKDVCSILNITNPRDLMAKQLDKQGVDKIYTHTTGGKQQLVYVNEPNLYRVIFRSNKPEAKQFQDWVFNEVLPTIRKTGSYNAPHSRQNAEPLDANDMTNLKHLISLMTNRFKYKDAWNQGIWFALRRATGSESPNPFTVEDLPALAQECRRIMEVTNDASSLICQFEKDVLKHVIRHRKELETISGKMQDDFQALQISAENCSTLAKFEQICLMRLENRAH